MPSVDQKDRTKTRAQFLAGRQWTNRNKADGRELDIAKQTQMVPKFLEAELNSSKPTL